jgi:phosphoribosylformylglycinamidine (FGAM) synthase-like enzyme
LIKSATSNYPLTGLAAAGHAGEDALLFDTVKAVGLELCPELGIAIPVGKRFFIHENRLAR